MDYSLLTLDIDAEALTQKKFIVKNPTKKIKQIRINKKTVSPQECRKKGKGNKQQIGQRKIK